MVYCADEVVVFPGGGCRERRLFGGEVFHRQWVVFEEIPKKVYDAAVKEAEASLTGKEPADKKDAIIKSKIVKKFSDRVLMAQPFVFDEEKTVADVIKESIAKTGENINVKQFKRIELGVTE